MDIKFKEQMRRIGNFLDLDKEMPRLSREVGLTAIGGTIILGGVLADNEAVAWIAGAPFVTVGASFLVGRGLSRFHDAIGAEEFSFYNGDDIDGN